MSNSTQRSNNTSKDHKQELVNVPELRFPEFTEEWSTYKLGDICKFSKGKGISKKDVTEKGTPCIRYGQLYTQYNELITETVSKTQLPLNDLVLSEENDIIIPSTGETAIDISQAACIKKDNIAIGGDINILKTNEDGVFLSYYLNYIKTDIAKMAQGISVIHLYADQLKKLTVNIPSLEEQRKISNLLLSINKKIDSMEKKYNKFLSIKKFFIKYLFDKLNIEKNKIVALGNISEINIGFTPSTKNTQFWEGNNKWLSITDLNEKYVDDTSKKISNEAIKNKKIIKKNTLVMSFKLTLGKLAILSDDMFSNEAICNFKWNMEVDTEYMYYYFNSIKIEKYGAIAAKGVTLNKEILKTIPVLLPSYKTQQEIGFFLKIIDDKISLINKEIELNKEFKHSLLSKMFC